MNQDMLDILIGKYLDSEITPAEEVMLDEELNANPQARALLKEMTALQHKATEAVTGMVADGRGFDDIFESAWDEARRPVLGWIRWPNMVRFAAGLAAGIMIAIGVYVLTRTAGPVEVNPNTDSVVVEGNTLPNTDEPEETVTPETEEKPAIKYYRMPRLADQEWYFIRDAQGNEYAIEGFRESDMENASYRGDL